MFSKPAIIFHHVHSNKKMKSYSLIQLAIWLLTMETSDTEKVVKKKFSFPFKEN